MSLHRHHAGNLTNDSGGDNGILPGANAEMQTGPALLTVAMTLPDRLPPDPAITLFDSTADIFGFGDSVEQTAGLGASFSTATDSVALSDLTLVLYDSTPNDGDDIQVTLWTDNGDSPGTELATLADIQDSSLQPSTTDVNLTITNSPVLNPNTRYWIELQSNTGTGNAIWAGTNGDAGTGVSSEFEDVYGSISANSSGQGSFLMEVQATQTCYAAGTHILTESGEVAVEALRPGDRLIARHAGGAAPVRWIGRRRADLRPHARPDDTNPVRIRANAFAPGKPHRDLILSPDHAVFIDNALLSVRYLINGATVVQESPDEICYFHIELDRHDIIFAEGLEAETFLDVGNRGFFADEARPGVIDAGFALPGGHRDMASQGCAPYLCEPAARAATHRRVLERAYMTGYRTTEDPGLARR